MDTSTMDKNINHQEDNKDIKIVIDEVDREKTDENRFYVAVVTSILCTLFCIGIGIMCIVVALEQNKSDENNMIYLEGQIVYVFYLGVGILFCVGMCLFGVLCAQCCGDFCLICAY